MWVHNKYVCMYGNPRISETDIVNKQDSKIFWIIYVNISHDRAVSVKYELVSV